MPLDGHVGFVRSLQAAWNKCQRPKLLQNFILIVDFRFALKNLKRFGGVMHANDINSSHLSYNRQEMYPYQVNDEATYFSSIRSLLVKTIIL